MALSFIKKVFTFGKPAEEPVPAAVERELEPRSRDEDLPVADDPVLAEEMDTAGGPAADIDEGGVEAAVAEDDVESSILPAADQLNDMVGDGEWRDYAIDHLKDRAVFSVFKRSGEMPLFRIEKNPKLAAKQGAYCVISVNGTILKRGHELNQVLKVFDKALKLVDK